MEKRQILIVDDEYIIVRYLQKCFMTTRRSMS